MSNNWKHLTLFSAGGWSYCLIEFFWRGHTHWSMFFVGGLCFVLIGLINEFFPCSTSILAQMLLSAVMVTAVELISGCVLNLWLGLHVWDYSHLPYNLKGQICLLYFNIWCLLSLPAIFLDDFLRWKWFEEERPCYCIL